MKSKAAESPRHHEVLIGVGINDRGQAVKVGAVISALGRPHDLIKRALHDLGQADATRITTFTDGDKMLRGYLTKAGVAAAPILDWQHLSRRVQVAKTTAKGLGCLIHAERRARPLIAKALDSLHWKLWHGDIYDARYAMTRVFKLLQPSDIDRTRAQTALAAKRLSARIDALENLAGDSFAGEAVWLVLEPGETTEQGMARWEAKHGPRQPGQRAIIGTRSARAFLAGRVRYAPETAPRCARSPNCACLPAMGAHLSV